MSNPSFDSSRRSAVGRQPEELHIPSTGLVNPNLSRQLPSNEYPTTPDAPVPSINVHSSSQPPHYGSGSGSNSNVRLPGALTPGNQQRPPAVSVNTAPSVLPTLPQASSQQSHRSSMINSHGHSRSSPAGFDQTMYKQHGSAEGSSYPSSPGAGYPPQTPQGSKYSPLGLADIRPPGNHLLGESLMSPSAMQYNGDSPVPSNSNYIAPWPIYAVDWCKWPIPGSSSSFGGKLALGSYLEDSHNYIQIIDTHWAQPDPDTQDAAAGEIKLDSNSITRPSGQRDTPTSKLSPLALLSNSKSPEHTAPITSLDWNTISPSLIITSSIDTTCTIWDIPTLTAKTQLIAHDKEVFDVRFCANSVDVFVSCGADGSVRMFDLRSLEHSTIIYEPTDKVEQRPVMSPGNASPSGPSSSGMFPPPLLRIAASPHDAHLLATFSQDSSVVRVLDVRQPGQALLELKGHGAPLNCVEWSPSKRGHLASGADDSLVLIWDLINQHNAVPLSPQAHTPGTPATTSERGPTAAWQCDYEVSNISWSPQGGPNHSGQPREWLGVCGGKGIWGVAL
ncbi:hypothetical protein N7470_010382 [Penicillium chermesinum]|nr:hypothetical protein N7470_010382 [Penicillium chermesinum]